jgi:hypothetical protein
MHPRFLQEQTNSKESFQIHRFDIDKPFKPRILYATTSIRRTQKMPRPRKQINLDFSAIETALNNGESVDLKRLAAQNGTCPPVIRRILSEHFGSRLHFKPGRNGGIRWEATQPTPADTTV